MHHFYFLNSDWSRKLLEKLMRLEETVAAIRIAQLRNLDSNQAAGSAEAVPEAVQASPAPKKRFDNLPFSSLGDFQSWVAGLEGENNGDLQEFFRLQGGTNVADAVSRCLRTCASDDMYKNYSLSGRTLKGVSKLPFKHLKLGTIIHGKQYICLIRL